MVYQPIRVGGERAVTTATTGTFFGMYWLHIENEIALVLDGK